MKGKEVKSLETEKDLNIILSVVIFIVVMLALHYTFIGLGIEPGKAIVEALVMASAIITPVVLYLFGRTWKRDI